MKQNSLIIDGNAVYELDMECLRKKRQLNEPLEMEEERREGVSNRVSIRPVEETYEERKKNGRLFNQE